MNDLKKPQQPKRLKVNKRLTVVIICFFVAALFWLLIALSQEYQTSVLFNVHYSHFPGQKVVMNDLPSKISVQVKTNGFKIMSLGFHKDPEPVEVDVSASLRNSSLTSDMLAIPTKYFINDFSGELGTDYTITGFQPDSIVFNFSDLVSRKIKIIPNFTATFEKQYDSTDSPLITPSEIIVSGPPSIVSKLSGIKTERLTLKNLRSDVQQNLKLINNRLLSYNLNTVEFYLPVEKFTEGSADIDINPVNVSTGYILKTFPYQVKVRYLVPLTKYNGIEASMFDAVVDASGLTEKRPAKLNVSLLTSPSEVRVTTLEPSKVDYILRKQ